MYSLCMTSSAKLVKPLPKRCLYIVNTFIFSQYVQRFIIHPIMFPTISSGSFSVCTFVCKNVDYQLDPR